MNYIKNKKIKCDFCQYYTKTGCTTSPDSFYCQRALEEYYSWLRLQRNKN